MIELLPWVLFTAFVLAMLAVDLGFFHREAHEVRRREALTWSAVWVGLAVLFNIGVYVFRGGSEGIEWTTGYLIEKSLAVDNVFVFLLIFSTFRVPAIYQHRVLFWGVIGALIMRGVLIAAASVLLSTLHFVIYVFGALLIVTGLKFLRDEQHAPDLNRNWLVRIAHRVLPTTRDYEGPHFFLRRSRVLYTTPLFLVLLLIEATDLVFAVDSIPAIFAVTDDPFIVYTSNVFAILGLRAMYFVLAGYLGAFRYVKPALAAILVFVGIKMLLADFYEVHSLASLAVIVTILMLSVAASIRANRAEQRAQAAAPPAIASVPAERPE